MYAPIGARLSGRSFLGELLNKDMYHHYNMIRGEDRMNPPQIVLQLGQTPNVGAS